MFMCRYQLSDGWFYWGEIIFAVWNAINDPVRCLLKFWSHRFLLLPPFIPSFFLLVVAVLSDITRFLFVSQFSVLLIDW